MSAPASSSHPIFNGRLSRKGLVIWSVISLFVAGLAGNHLGLGDSEILIIFLLGIIPGAVRRAHDMGLSGHLCILLVIPPLNFLVGIALLMVPGKPEANQWGPPLPGSGSALNQNRPRNAAKGQDRDRENSLQRVQDEAEFETWSTSTNHSAGNHPLPAGFDSEPQHRSGQHPLPDGFEQEPQHAAGQHPLSDDFFSPSKSRESRDMDSGETTFDFSFNLDDYSVEKLRKRWEDDDRD